MVHKNAAEYTHSFAHSNWRILIQDDHNDLVITWQHYHHNEGKLKWIGMGHLDQTDHGNYHAHMNEDKDDKKRISIGVNLSDTEKLQKGMTFLKLKAKQRQICYENDYLSPEDIHMGLVPQLHKKAAINGTRANSVSINATAAIITANGGTSSISTSE
jgi:hypothetical protein